VGYKLIVCPALSRPRHIPSLLDTIDPPLVLLTPLLTWTVWLTSLPLSPYAFFLGSLHVPPAPARALRFQLSSQVICVSGATELESTDDISALSCLFHILCGILPLPRLPHLQIYMMKCSFHILHPLLFLVYLLVMASFTFRDLHFLDFSSSSSLPKRVCLLSSETGDRTLKGCVHLKKKKIDAKLYLR
jgi:hypothetical protein